MKLLNNSQASLECRRTPWDERTFGFPCAEITFFHADDEFAGLEILHQFEAWVQVEGVQFAYGRFDSTQLTKKILHQADFYFAEASYRIHHYKIQNTEALDRLIRRGPVLELAKELDYEALRNILAMDFKHGRIHEDPWVSLIDSSLRYRNWLSDLLDQKYQIYAYKYNNEVIGIHVQSFESEKVNLLLTGVKSSHSLLGVSLWAEVMKLNREQGVQEMKTLISIANIPIINLYKKLDFQFEELLLGFHKRWSFN